MFNKSAKKYCPLAHQAAKAAMFPSLEGGGDIVGIVQKSFPIAILGDPAG
jgi:hypothetical protein